MLVNRAKGEMREEKAFSEEVLDRFYFGPSRNLTKRLAAIDDLFHRAESQVKKQNLVAGLSAQEAKTRFTDVLKDLGPQLLPSSVTLASKKTSSTKRRECSSLENSEDESESVKSRDKRIRKLEKQMENSQLMLEKILNYVEKNTSPDNNDEA